MNRQSLKDKYAAINSKKTFVSFLQPTSVLDSLGLKVYKCTQGKNFLTFLPQRNRDEADFFLNVKMHSNIGPDKDQYLCLNKMYDEHCPICQHRAELEQAGEPYDVFKAFYPRDRFLFFVLDMSQPDGSSMQKGIHIFDAPQAIMKGVISVSENPRTGDIADISDPNTGFTLVFSKSGEKLNTEYGGFLKEQWNRDIPKKYYDMVPSFEDILLKPDPDKIDRKLGRRLPSGNMAGVAHPVRTIVVDPEDIFPPNPEDGDAFPETEEAQLEAAKEAVRSTVRTRRRAVPPPETEDESPF